MAENKANISYRVDESRLRELKLAALDRGQSLQGMIEEALDRLLAGGKKQSSKYTRDEEDLIDIIVGITRKDPGAVEKLRPLLKNIAALYRS